MTTVVTGDWSKERCEIQERWRSYQMLLCDRRVAWRGGASFGDARIPSAV